MPTAFTFEEASINPFSSAYYADLDETDPTFPANSSSLYLYKEGCWVKDVQNCTAMCSDPSLIWATTVDGKFNPNVTANVGNCVTYVIISHILDQTGDHITSGSDLVSKYGIQSARQVEALNINASISSCLTNFCNVKSNDCGTANSSAPQFQIFSIGPDIINVPSYTSLCQNYNGEINPDIAGIGVLSSYIIAAAILLVMYIMARLTRNLLKYLGTPYFFLSDLSRDKTWSHAWTRGRNLQKSVASSHHAAILMTSLTDFQKGQCIFWLSIDVAVLLGVSGAVNTLQATSVADFRANQISLQVICVGAYTCTVFGLYCLHLASKRSWYVFTLSFLTVVLSGAAWAATYTATMKRIEPDPIASNLQDYCGIFPPQTYCTTIDSVNTISQYQFDSILVASGGICSLVLLCDMIIHRTSYRTSTFAQRFCTCERRPSRWRLVLRSILRFSMELLSILLSVVLFWALIGIAFYIPTNGSKWGFGQILALTIWIPALLEWLYASIRGLENVAEHRLADPYKIVRIDQTTDTNTTVEYTQLGLLKGGQQSGSNRDNEHLL